MKTAWICELCFPDAKELGLVAPDLALMLLDGKYYLCWGQGHRDDEIFYCEEKPTIDPDPDCTAMYNSEGEKDWMDLADEAYERLRFAPCTGHAFYVTCQGGGYNRESHGLLGYWLYNKCGQVVANYEANTDGKETGEVPTTTG